MPQPRYTVDLADAGRLRRMSGEFLERGLCPVRASQLPAVEAEVILVLQLPGAATLEVPGQVVRLIPGRGFVARLDRTRAAPVLEAVRALLQGPSPEPSPSPSGLRDGTRPWEDAADAVDPLGGTILHPSATQGAPPASSAPDAAPTEAELVVLEKVQPKGRRSLVGQVLEEKYKVVRLLGQGGMGEVYEATHRYLEKRVALKVLLPDLARDPAFVTRFLREARSVSGLTSPHTVKVHDFGASSDGTLYFTMDLLEGRPLTRVIDEEAPLPFSRAAAIILQACHSLGEAHAAGLLHRDIKPDNLFVSRGPNGIDHVTLLDFGIVRPVSGGERLTVTGTICGTPHYLSPEQAQGKDLDIRSDLYSLGVILYEMLTGVCPFDADNTVAVLMKQIQELPPPLTAAYPDLRIDPRVDELLSAILAKDPARRPPTAAALADALRKVAEDIGLPIPGEPTRSRRAEPAAAARHRERWAPPPPADKARRTLLRIPGPSRFGLPPWAGYLLSALFVLLVLALWRPWRADTPPTLVQPSASPPGLSPSPGPVREAPLREGDDGFPQVAPPAWAVLQPSGIRSGTEEELTDGDSSSPDEATPPTEPGMPPPEAPDYVSLERRRAFCQHVVTLTAREWAVEDPAYNEVLDRIRTGPDAYPAPLQEIYRDCLDGFLRRGITEGEVDCTLRSGSLAEIENCGTGR